MRLAEPVLKALEGPPEYFPEREIGAEKSPALKVCLHWKPVQAPRAMTRLLPALLPVYGTRQALHPERAWGRLLKLKEQLLCIDLLRLHQPYWRYLNAQ